MATVKALIDQARRDLDDPEVPGGGDDSLSLFSTEELVSYLNRAVDEACIRTELIVDSDTPEVTRIAVVAGQASYPIDARVLHVKRVRLTGVSQATVLEKSDRDSLDSSRPNWEDETGVPRYYLQDMNQALRLYPTPDKDAQLALTVWRRPLETLKSHKAAVQEPPIPPEHHFQLLDWVYYLALGKQDVDTYQPEQARSHGQRFAEWFGDRKSAWEMEFDRKKNPHLRSVGKFM